MLFTPYLRRLSNSCAEISDCQTEGKELIAILNDFVKVFRVAQNFDISLFVHID